MSSENGAYYTAELRIKKPDGSPDGDFVGWVNDYRRPLHTELRAGPSTNLLAARGIEVSELFDVVAQITDTPRYPRNRLITTAGLVNVKSYKPALDAVTPGFEFYEAEDKDSQYNAMLGVVMLNALLIQNCERARVADSTLFGIGEAAICSLVDIHVIRDPEPGYRRWSGYQWWFDDNSYGSFLQRGALSKISAIARQELGIVTDGKPHPDPRLEPYRRENNYYFGYDAGAAMVLDTLNRAAGIPDDQPGIHRAIWEFGINGRDEAARDVVAEIMRKATNGEVALEELEAIDVSQIFPLEILARVEGACGVPAGQRISEYDPEYYSSRLLRTEIADTG